MNTAVNPMDLEIRDIFTPMVKFVDFRDQTTENALYGPAMIQKKQEKKVAEDSGTDGKISALSLSQTASETEGLKSMTKTTQQNSTAACSQILSQQFSLRDSSKSHFIKKQQSHCNIKRECGVSYVKKS